MQIAEVVGTVVATHKHAKLHGAKLLLVQPQTPGGEPRGVTLLAIDSVGAGVGERVLVVIEGKAAGDALGRRRRADRRRDHRHHRPHRRRAMNEEQLRTLVRDAVARHLAVAPAATSHGPTARATTGHASFPRYLLPSGDDDEGPCLIEPSVRCNHCGYCQSHGF